PNPSGEAHRIDAHSTFVSMFDVLPAELHKIRVKVDFRDQPSRCHPCERLRSLTRLLVAPPVRKVASLRRQMSAYDLFDLRDAKLEILCRGRNYQKVPGQKQILFFHEQLFERLHRSEDC